MRRSDLGTGLTTRLSGPDGRGVVAAYLFGSHAMERSHRESDCDLGVLLDYALLPSRRDRFEAGLRLRAVLQAAIGSTPLDLVILNDAPPRFAAAIATRGHLIHCTDKDAEHAFRRDSQLRAADLLPFLRRTSAIKREAIRR